MLGSGLVVAAAPQIVQMRTWKWLTEQTIEEACVEFQARALAALDYESIGAMYSRALVLSLSQTRAEVEKRIVARWISEREMYLP